MLELFFSSSFCFFLHWSPGGAALRTGPCTEPEVGVPGHPFSFPILKLPISFQINRFALKIRKRLTCDADRRKAPPKRLERRFFMCERESRKRSLGYFALKASGSSSADVVQFVWRIEAGPPAALAGLPESVQCRASCEVIPNLAGPADAVRRAQPRKSSERRPIHDRK